MVLCPTCQKENTLDGKFCNACGTALSTDALRAAQEQCQKLLDEGRKLFNESRFEEGLLVAEAIVNEDPSSIDAFSLIADCYERLGRFSAALKIREKVMALHPDSALEKIKLDHLRKKIEEQALEVPRPNSKFALLGASAAVVLFATLLTLLTVYQPSRSKSSPLVSNSAKLNEAPNSFQNLPFGPNDVSAGQGQPGSSQGNAQQTPATAGQANENSAREAAANTANPNRATRQSIPDPTDSRSWANASTQNGTLPAPTGSLSGPIEGGTKPMPAPVPGSLALAPSKSSNSSTQQDPDPNAEAFSKPAKSAPVENSIIEIKPTGGPKSNKVISGTQTVSSKNESSSENFVRVARHKFLSGDYRGAADSYEKALKEGADSGSTNQRLAQAYEKMGKRDEAAIAYERSLKAYQSRLKTSSDKSRIQSSIEAVEQAIKVLKGS